MSICESSHKMTIKEQVAFDLGYKKAQSEIVHCKDCAHFTLDYAKHNYMCCCAKVSPIYQVSRKDDDFCSYGVRKDGNNA